MSLSKLLHVLSFAALSMALATSACAQEKVLNVYSSRHYQTDQKLYTDFRQMSGIRVNLIEGNEDALIERIKSEGANSPADVLITVDAGRLWRAEQQGLFSPVRSKTLENRIPSHFRHREGKWFGFSYRTRVIVYNKDKVKAGEVRSYADLADTKWKGRVCTRSSGHVYNLSLLSALIVHLGESKARTWAKALKENLAQDPKGGDTDQIKAVAAGACDIALSNHYYYVRLIKSDKPEEKTIVDKVALVWPDQQGKGTHVNISGAGLVKTAPNKLAGIKFLEYLASDQAQAYFAAGNNEWPVVAKIAHSNPALTSLGTFKTDALNVGLLGENQALAQKIFDQVGYK